MFPECADQQGTLKAGLLPSCTLRQRTIRRGCAQAPRRRALLAPRRPSCRADRTHSHRQERRGRGCAPRRPFCPGASRASSPTLARWKHAVSSSTVRGDAQSDVCSFGGADAAWEPRRERAALGPGPRAFSARSLDVRGGQRPPAGGRARETTETRAEAERVFPRISRGLFERWQRAKAGNQRSDTASARRRDGASMAQPRGLGRAGPRLCPGPRAGPPALALSLPFHLVTCCF